MAHGSDWLLHSASVFWIFTLMLSESQSKKTQTYYMESSDCNQKYLGGAVVYSHLQSKGDYYSHDIYCRMVFKAEKEGWKLMLRVIKLDIPDRTVNGYCNDALYIYNDSTSVSKAMKDAGGTGGLCGTGLPPTLKSTTQFMTVVFQTDNDGPVGTGFKFVITAFNEDHKLYGNCGDNFECDNHLCIAHDLTCDGVDSCGDYSDEAGSGRAMCKEECTFMCKFMSLGVTASIFISVGSIVIFASCVVALICCCRRAFCKKPQDQVTCNTNVVTTATAVMTNGNGGVPPGTGVCGVGYQGKDIGPRAPSAFSNHGYTHQGYYPMQPVYPTPHGSVYSYAKDPFAPVGSAYSSNPSTNHRSHTPTSSKSGKSNRSNNSTSVTYSQGTEKVSLPVNL